MKKKIVVALLLSLGLLAAGCSGNTNKETTASTKAATETETSSATKQETETAKASEGTEGTQSESESETQVQTEKNIEYKALDYVTLGDYKGLEVTLEKAEVTDAEIELEIQSQVSQQNKLVEVKDGTVENGDVVNIDYEGKMDGKAVDGASDKAFDLTIGSNTFFEGFESGLIGVKSGESKDLNLTFPDNYKEELKGKPVVFHITVNSIKRMPELTDELAKQLSGEETIAAYKEKIKSDLLAQKATSQDSTLKGSLVSKAAENSKIKSYPEDVVTQRVQQMKSYYENYAKQSSMSLEDFLQANMGMSEEDFMTKANESTKQSLDQEMVLNAIAEKEKFEVSEDEYNAGVKAYSQQYGFESEEEFMKQYSKDIVETSLMQEKVVQFLLDNAKITNPEDKLTATEKTTEAASEKETQKESATEKETKAAN